MNILIVDDEQIAIDAVISGLNWASLPFTHRFEASNKSEAVKIIKNQKIDVMLCDIEMPMGNGLELLEWVNQNYPAIRCIFMTCHADIQLAQKAMRLGSVDYILKPLNFEDLQTALLRASQQVVTNKKYTEIVSRKEQYEEDITRYFWKKLFSGEIASNIDSVERYWKSRGSTFPVRNIFLPVLISVKKVEKGGEKLLLYGLSNISKEIFLPLKEQYQVIYFSDKSLLVVFNHDPNKNKHISPKEILPYCQSLVNLVRQYMDSAICCCIGVWKTILDVADVVEKLQEIELNNVILKQNVILLENGKRIHLHSTSSHFADWEVLCKNGQYRKITQEIRREVEKTGSAIDRNMLSTLYRNFYVLLFNFAQQHNIFLQELFEGEAVIALSNAATNSTYDFIKWVDYAMLRLERFSQSQEGNRDPIEQAKEYIQAHLSEEITVEEIAEQVYLNADYLNRLFKKKTGLVLSKYIIQQKMERAIWLLSHTELSIGDIAAQVGYYNYSSFSRAFCRIVQCSPQEFKKNLKE